jgi:hypothetical protein
MLDDFMQEEEETYGRAAVRLSRDARYFSKKAWKQSPFSRARRRSLTRTRLGLICLVIGVRSSLGWMRRGSFTPVRMNSVDSKAT